MKLPLSFLKDQQSIPQNLRNEPRLRQKEIQTARHIFPDQACSQVTNKYLDHITTCSAKMRRGFDHPQSAIQQRNKPLPLPPIETIGLVQSAAGTYKISTSPLDTNFIPLIPQRLTLHRRNATYDTTDDGPGSYFTIQQESIEPEMGPSAVNTVSATCREMSNKSSEDIISSKIANRTCWHDLPLEIRHLIVKHYLALFHNGAVCPTPHIYKDMVIAAPQSLIPIGYRFAQDLKFTLQRFIAYLTRFIKFCDKRQEYYSWPRHEFTALQMEEHKTEWVFWGDVAHHLRVLIKWAVDEVRMAEKLSQGREEEVCVNKEPEMPTVEVSGSEEMEQRDAWFKMQESLEG